MDAMASSRKTGRPKTRVATTEKVSAQRTASYFAPFKARADLQAFDRLIRREGGEPPATDDEIAAD